MTIQELLDSPPGTEFELSLTEQELNEAAASMLAVRSGLPLSSPEVELEAGVVIVRATTEFSGVPLRVEVTGAPAVADGQLRLDVTDMSLNGGAAPVFVRSQVADSINEQLRGPDFPLDVDFVQVQPGELKVRGRRR